jgi:hypothetical protein
MERNRVIKLTETMKTTTIQTIESRKIISPLLGFPSNELISYHSSTKKKLSI